ncbi:hypothetical protein OIDMADRAFT_150272 [Oidiodendron maius Zn]|uniref:C2H2-type domain-containing protein n=1 Tax=Oidiodendron maius (strain Zn) TaxID=913774 RepID=A0A0C3HLZ5_OIDMZ|nr:hypothetical protein OIDMADRAFT_150272 [Oidiodendron maius Zn]
MRVLCDAIGSGTIDEQSLPPPPPPTFSASQPGLICRRFGPVHRCRICDRVYERADHHLKSHENARQFKCAHCSKTFNRADLLSRHRTKHFGSTANFNRNKRADRAAIACISCISAKVKCQDDKPCTRCTKKGISCAVPSVDSHGKPGKADAHNHQDSRDGNDRIMNDGNGATIEGIVHNPTHSISPGAYVAQNTTATFADETFNPFSISINGDFDQYIPIIPGGFSQDLDFNFWDLDISSIELAQVHTPTSAVEDVQNWRERNDEWRVRRDTSKRQAAFERSPWLYRPTSPAHADIVPCSMDSNTRDRILSLLISKCRDANQVRSFPSLDLMNNLIRIFLAQEILRTHCLIHVGTFNSSKCLPQLLLAIIALGASYISVPSIWKMGLALQEVVRHTVAELWEQNNINIRNLQTLQAFMMCLDIGLWSGFQRQMEIAESFAQPIVVMIRRSGAMGRQRYAGVLPPNEDDSPSILELKWKKWVEAESFKRLIIRLFTHDIGASIGMQKPPLMSLTEFKFPLPASRDLWMAKSAKEWRELCHSAPIASSNMLTFADVMKNFDNLESASEPIDRHLCVETILHGFWGQIWSYHESKRFYPEGKAAHRLCLMTAQKEMYRDLLDFSARIPNLTRASPMTTLTSELLMMLLHADPDQLQTFAGKYGEDEAKQAASGFREWIQSSDSRVAIWHAGQVFQAAKKFPTARLQGFSAVAVYYASLTLWIYGLMSLSTSPTEFSPISNIPLNGLETPQSRRFLGIGEGRPGLSIMIEDEEAENIFVPLEASDRVLSTARDIYRANFPVEDAPLPPLVNNLGNLLRDLSSLPGSRISRVTSEERAEPS